ncbi:MAG: sigma-70 family RNA polymerase sigma factor [Acidobacteriota bacterium]
MQDHPVSAKATMNGSRSDSGDLRVFTLGLPDRQAGTSAARAGRSGDQVLVTEFLHGDPEAADTIARWIRQATGRYRDRLPTEWPDLLQDLLLEVTSVLRQGTFRGDCTLRTFVWRIAHYRCLNRIRDLARRPESELADVAQHVPDPARPVLERLVDRESEDLLRRFLDTISTDCRRMWRLILAGRSYREMSREIGVSEGALRVRVLRCRKKALAQWRSWLESTHG